MRFQATHKLASYVLVAVAMASLAAAGLVAPLAAALAFAGLLLSWFAEPTSFLGVLIAGRGALPARLIAVAFLALTVWEVAAHLPEPDLSPIISLLLFLVVFKLFHRRSNRDYLHLYILSFLLILAAAAFAQSAVFLVGFWLYVLLTTWTLMLFHLRREMEENYLVKHSTQAPSQKVGVHRILNSRRVVGRWFFVLTAGVAVVIFAGALVTFMLVPRVGAGFVLGGPKPRRFLVGFSDEVALGQSGFLSSDNRAVALRATVPRLASLDAAARDRELENLYWRGTVYDTYDHGHWARSRTPGLATDLEPLGRQWIVKEPGFRGSSPFPPLANTIRQEIDIVGLQVPVAFGLDQPIAFELQDAQPGVGAAAELRLVPRWSSEVALRLFSRSGSAGSESEEGRTAGGAHYVVFSRDSLAHASAQSGIPVDELDPDLLRPYLALPSELSPRVQALARTITAGKPTASAKLQAVIDWLGRTHGYSTQLKRHTAVADPLEDFLFEQKAGHCEYFASAAAVLLRAAGVPTRYVNGFLGGEWNALGEHVTVRQNRAHSWAEAYLGEFGWVRVDATPSIKASRSMSRLSEMVDSLELWWSRWVVSYDFARQIDLARSLGKRLGLLPSPGGRAADGALSWRRHKLGFINGAAALVLGLGVMQWRRRRPRRSEERIRRIPSGTPVGQLYEKALRRLAAGGFPRRPSETPREYLERARTVGLQGWEVLERITTHYEDARFGGALVEEGIVRALARRIAELVPSSEATGITKVTAVTGG